MRSSRHLAIVVAFFLPLLSALAADVITNVMSPIVSYQYLEDFGSAALTNGGIISPIVSYQYCEWPGDGILNLQSSPVVSYYYQFLDAPLLNIFPTSWTPTTAESTPAFLLTPPAQSQLETFVGGAFITNSPFPLNTNRMTIVLTHGWNSNPDEWATNMATLILNNITPAPNAVAWDWRWTAKATLPGTAAAQTPNQGIALAQSLANALGLNYSQRIHFVGHSLGTLVNAYAANFLQGTNWASEPVSSTPWLAANVQMTLFDEAEAATDITSFLAAIETLLDMNGNPLSHKPSYYHPLPRQFIWADNFVSAFGLLHPEAANVILTNNFPSDAPSVTDLFNELSVFHGYPIQWYDETIQTNVSPMGFLWSFEQGGQFSQAPRSNSVYVQAFNDSQWNLATTNWAYGTNLLNGRFQAYRNFLAYAITNETLNSVAANGTVWGQIIVGAAPAFNSFILFLLTTPGNAPTPPLGPHPLGGGGNTNAPAYAWLPLLVPANAVSMSFDYKIQGDWQNDSLAAALNGTNVLSIPGGQIQADVLFASGPIDVSAFAGQTNEFFIGIVGGTSTNAELTVENLAFSISSPPSLQAQESDGMLVLLWPLSAQNFSLQTTTNLADPSSWTTQTNVPAVVNFQNVITNPITGGRGFYRLVQSTP